MTLSIIIGTAGRPVSLKATIHSLLALSPAQRGTEILVVDNNMDEELVADLRSYCEQLSGQVRYVREASPGLTAARHCGIRESSGEILTFVENDVEVSSGWLGAVQDGFRIPDVGMIGGPSIPMFTGSIPEWLWGFIHHTPYGGWMCPWLSLLDIGKNVEHVSPLYIWGLNFSIRRSIIERFGGFHPDLVPSQFQRWQGDGESGLATKIEAAGIRADYLQDALVFHQCGPERLTVENFRRRAFYQGIAESFTRIRSGHDPRPESSPSRHKSFRQRLRAAAGRLAHTVTRGRFRRSAAAASIWQATREAHIAGWRFHQTEVASDPGLLAWVRRADFNDADIRVEASRGPGK